MISATMDAVSAWFDTAPNRERSGSYDDLKLEPIRRVLAELPCPPRPVTVAGTKGKGSTVAILEALLLAHGRSTVAFTSPHVLDLRERWRLDGCSIDVVRLAEACTVVEAAQGRCATPLTYFERCFAVACVLAAQHPQAVFLCEVGLGGRLDCANVLDTRLAILTHLSYDHTHILGNTLEAIAGEKLAVARPDAPLLIAAQSSEGAKAVQARLADRSSATWVGALADDWSVGLAGGHQRDNAAAAVAAARHLLGDEWSPERARQAVAVIRLAARCQLVDLDGGRRLIIDGAHNAASIAATLAVVPQLLRRPWYLILGLAQDKDAEAIIPEIVQAAPEAVHRCAYAWARSRGPHDWPVAAQDWPWHDSISAALAALPATGDVCITGSFYLAGEALLACGHGDVAAVARC